MKPLLFVKSFASAVYNLAQRGYAIGQLIGCGAAGIYYNAKENSSTQEFRDNYKIDNSFSSNLRITITEGFNNSKYNPSDELNNYRKQSNVNFKKASNLWDFIKTGVRPEQPPLQKDSNFSPYK